MKKLTLVSILFLLFAFAPAVLAQGFTALAPIPGLTDTAQTSVVNSASLASFFNNLYKYLIGLAASFAVIMIIWGGLEISTQDSISKKGAGKEKITNAIFGLVLVLSPVLVFSIINPSILNLSLNLPPLDTKSGAANSGVTATGPSAATTDAATGCSVSGTKGIFQIADCSSAAAATAWGLTCTTDKGRLEVTPLTNNPDGTMATSRSFCVQANVFEFIDVHTSALTSSIGRLQPLAIAAGSRINTKSNGTEAVYPNNGTNAVQFAAICQNLGWKTCISDRPLLTFSHACDPMPKTTLPAGTPLPAKCYTENLGCRDASFIDNDMCSSNPGWAPFQ